MKRAALTLLIALISGCAGGNGSQSSTATPSPTVSATETATAAATATATATQDPLAAVQYTDIAGNFAETPIKQEAALGIFGPTTTGTFNPDGQVTRAQYIDWLVTANNIYFKATPAAQIRLADSSTDQTFVDVPKSSQFFPQIEGMANAGFVIGIDKTHFAPDQPLTREELIAIQTSRYRNGAPFENIASASGMYCVHLTDASSVSKPYWGAFNTDQCTGFNGQDDLHRIFGSVRTLHPQKPVTRAEVAVALQKINGGTPANALPH
jgi:hypothetical protein